MIKPDPGAPLPLSARMGDDDYPGVVRLLDAGWRLSVSMDASRYVVQARVDTDCGPRWVTAGGRQPADTVKLAAKFASVPGLADALSGLPRDPGAALPAFLAARVEQRAMLNATDWRRDDYPGEVARDGSLRLVVTPCRGFYRLQWVARRDIGTGCDWKPVCEARCLSDVWAVVHQQAAVIEGPGRSGLVRGDDLLPRWQAFVKGLPELPGDAVPSGGRPAAPLQAERAT